MNVRIGVWKSLFDSSPEVNSEVLLIVMLALKIFSILFLQAAFSFNTNIGRLINFTA